LIGWIVRTVLVLTAVLALAYFFRARFEAGRLVVEPRTTAERAALLRKARHLGSDAPLPARTVGPAPKKKAEDVTEDDRQKLENLLGDSL
jgi:hypothetical protein